VKVALKNLLTFTSYSEFKRVFPYDGARKLSRWAQKPWTFWGKEMIESQVWHSFHTYAASPKYTKPAPV
ncbi:MAG: hypothetical protein F6K14_33315, partial [Symploca sp. SIO2C1]|nr:hypothetical protein [Symploca sp. SIO2C1]